MTVELNNAVSAPKSLDVNFFQDVLENGLQETNVSIKKISFEMGSSGGDNYCSQIYRVRIAYERGNRSPESVSVIVKSIPVSKNSQFLDDLKVFQKEKIFYYNMLPRMEILLDNVNFAPKLYHAVKEPINTLVFADLNSLSFSMANREMGLDLRHSQLVMKKLGQFHGTSMVLFKKDPKSMNAFHCGLLDATAVRNSEIYSTLLGMNIRNVAEIASKWKGYERIADKLNTYNSDLKENLIKSQLPIQGELRVLNHGDLWLNNMLFKYTNDNRDQVEDVVFVDFQMSIFGSPGYDINYFLNTSLQLDVLENHREDLVRIYYSALCEVLSDLKYDAIPTFNDILTEVSRRESYGFIANCAIFPAVTISKEHSKDNSIDNFLDEEFAENKAKIMFSSERLNKTMQYTLKRFDKLGVLD